MVFIEKKRAVIAIRRVQTLCKIILFFVCSSRAFLAITTAGRYHNSWRSLEVQGSHEVPQVPTSEPNFSMLTEDPPFEVLDLRSRQRMNAIRTLKRLLKVVMGEETRTCDYLIDKVGCLTE